MAQLHDQNCQLRASFLRADPRLSGTLPGFMIQPVLRAGGLELTTEQAKTARKRFVTGEGRFNWFTFCESVEKARGQAWSPRLRMQTMRAFADLDVDGSGTLNREEVRKALGRLNFDSDPENMEKIIDSCDNDGSGTISYEEFIDALARDRVTAGSVFSTVAKTTKGPIRSTSVRGY